MNKYYISIKTTGLSYYINNALILPVHFYNKERPKDIQNLVNDYILVSKDKYLNDSDCSMEVILTDEEIKNSLQKIDNNLFLYSLPIPLSRIRKIFFLDDTKKRKTISHIERNNGFIFDKIVEVKIEDRKEVKLDNIEKFEYNQELIDKIKHYDQILGGIAFTRHDINGEYFKIYFSLLSYFNNLIKEELKKNKIEREDKYKGAFDGSGSWKNIYPLLYEQIEEEDVLNQAKKEKIEVIKNTSELWDISNIKPQSWTYLLAILNNYGEDSTKRKKTNDLLSNFKNQKIPIEKQEGISLIYGINNGYSKFFNKYDKKIVKFKMDSLLDYYTIESIYQYVFNNQKENYKFEYLDKNIEVRKKPIFSKKYEIYQIIDETVVVKNKKTVIAKIKEFLKENLFLELEKYIDNLFENIKILNNSNFELERKNINLINENNDLKKELENKNQELNEIKNNSSIELDRLKKEIESLQQEKKEIINQFEILKTEEQKIKNKFENLQNENNNNVKKLQEENKRLKAKIETFNKIKELEKKSIKELKNLCQEKNINFNNKDKKEILINRLVESNSNEKTLFQVKESNEYNK